MRRRDALWLVEEAFKSKLPILPPLFLSTVTSNANDRALAVEGSLTLQITNCRLYRNKNTQSLWQANRALELFLT